MKYHALTPDTQTALKNERILSAEKAHYQAVLDVQIAKARADAAEEKTDALKFLAKAESKLEQAAKELTITLQSLV